jgi:hypothetical protein
MSLVPIQLGLAKRDMYITQIDEEIKNKKLLLVQKKKALDKKEKVNVYLEGVNSDYTKYYNYIVEEKQKEYNAMKMLKEYITDLMETEKLLANHLIAAKYDQKEILSEIDKIKHELDQLIA